MGFVMLGDGVCNMWMHGFGTAWPKHIDAFFSNPLHWWTVAKVQNVCDGCITFRGDYANLSIFIFKPISMSSLSPITRCTSPYVRVPRFFQELRSRAHLTLLNRVLSGAGSKKHERSLYMEHSIANNHEEKNLNSLKWCTFKWTSISEKSLFTMSVQLSALSNSFVQNGNASSLTYSVCQYRLLIT